MTRYSHEAAGLDLSERDPFELYRPDLKDRVKYPRGWLKSASEAEIAALGFVAYQPDPEPIAEPSTDPRDWPLSRRQLRLGLLGLGLTEAAVLAAINSIADATERNIALIEWQDAEEYNYDHPLVSTLMLAADIAPEIAAPAWLAAKEL